MTVEAVDPRSSHVICTWVAERVQRHGRFLPLHLQKVQEKPIEPGRTTPL